MSEDTHTPVLEPDPEGSVKERWLLPDVDPDIDGFCGE